MSIKAKIESVLFLTDKPIHAASIAKLINEDVQKVRQVIVTLIQEYEERGGGLEISQDNGYIIQVKDEYAWIIEEFLPMEMSAALLRTLSAIAIKQPVMQSEIVRIRGAGAYEHIKELVEKDLVSKKEDGRSPILTTTKQFQEYFRLTSNAKILRQQMRKQENPEPQGEGEPIPQEGEGIQLSMPINMEPGAGENTENTSESTSENISENTQIPSETTQVDSGDEYKQAFEKLLDMNPLDEPPVQNQEDTQAHGNNIAEAKANDSLNFT